MGENGLSAGTISLKLKLDTSGFKNRLNDLKNRIKSSFNTGAVGNFGNSVKATTGLFPRLTASVKTFGKAVIAAFTIRAIAAFANKCVTLASNLVEVENVVATAFPKMYEYVDNFAKNAASRFGLSETMAKQYIGTFGAMAQAFGFTEKQAAAMSTTLTGLAGDVASFYNITQDEAYNKLKSVFTGETESLKELGIVMTQSALDSYAMANGFGHTTSAMSEAEKVALRYSFVQEKLAMAQGDVARTSNSWANQIRYLKVQIQTLGSMIGQLVMKVLSPLVQAINFVLSKIIDLGKGFASIFGKKSGIGQTKADLGGISGEIGNITDGYQDASSGADKASRNTGKLGKALKKAAKDARNLMGFDQINKVQEKQSTDSGPGGGNGGGGSSIGGGGGVTGAGLNIDTSMIDDLKSKVTKKLGPIWDKLIASLKRCRTAFSNLWKVVKKAFMYIWDNILKPFGTWIIETLAPVLVDILTGAINVVTAALKAMSPVAKFLWEKILQPIAKKIGEILVAVLKKVAEWLEKLAQWINDHPKLFAGIATTILAVVAAFKAFTIIKKVIGFFQKVKKVFGVAKLVLAGLSPTVLIVIGVIAALVVAGVLLYKNWDKIKPKLKKFVDFFKQKWADLKKKVQPILDKITELIGKLKEKWDAFKNKTVELVAEAKEKVDGALEWLGEKWEAIKDKAAALIAEAKEKVSGAIEKLKGAWETVKDRTATLVAEAKEKVTGAIENLKEGWAAAVEIVTDHTGTMTATLKDSFSSFIGDLKTKWTDAKDKIVTQTKTFTTKTADSFSGKIAGIKKTWGDYASKIADKTRTFTTKISNSFSDKIKGIKDKWDSYASKIGNKTRTFTAELKDSFASKIKDIKDKWDSYASKISNKTRTFTTEIKDSFSSKIAGIKKKWDDFKSKIGNVTKNFSLSVGGKLPKITWSTKTKKVGPISIDYPWPSVTWEKLAQGGFIRKNTPQLAVVGDNRHQGEYVAPEKKLEAMANKAAAGAAGSGNAEMITMMRTIIQILQTMDTSVYLDGKSIKDNVVKRINQNTRATGVCEIVT